MVPVVRSMTMPAGSPVAVQAKVTAGLIWVSVAVGITEMTAWLVLADWLAIEATVTVLVIVHTNEADRVNRAESVAVNCTPK